MAYDPLLGELVLFGGESQNNIPLGATWVYSNQNWSRVATAIAPPARFADGMAYDPTLGGVVLFGGKGASTFFDDTWLFDAAGWHKLALLHPPPPMGATSLVYDSTIGKLLLLGPPPGARTQTFWELDGNRWVNLTKSVGVLPPDVWGNVVNDPAVHGLLYYGGTNGCFNPSGGSALTWTYSNGDWKNVTRSQSLAPMNPMGSTAMTYDPSLNGVVMFSGYTLGCVAVHTTYLFTGGLWTNLTGHVGAPPPPRWNARLVHVPGVGDIMFSGNVKPIGGSNRLGRGTWVLETIPH